jgi:hypothetical protein
MRTPLVSLALASLPAQQPLAVQDLPASAPLTVAATATPAELTVVVSLQTGWHLYGRDTGGGQPVALNVQPGSAFAAAGPLQAPMDQKGEITGTAPIKLPLRRTGTGRKLEVAFRFMACDALMCLPPMQVVLAGEVADAAGAAPRVLLVVIEEGERSARTAAFLQQRGFPCTLATYDKVTAEQCDAHDVVLADSPYFEEARRATKLARAFPRTSAPIVAVGFLGTELLEAHKVAMACGYI